MITSANAMLYSVSAVRRIFNVAQELKIKVQVWAFVIWIHIEGQRPTFLSKRLFKIHFVQWRQEQSRQLEKNQINHRTVKVSGLKKDYFVEFTESGIECSCEDYKNQQKFLGRGCCKHGYAALGVLGFHSLSKYLEALGPGGWMRAA